MGLLLLLVLSRNNRETLQTSSFPSDFPLAFAQEKQPAILSVHYFTFVILSLPGLSLAVVEAILSGRSIPGNPGGPIFSTGFLLPQVACHEKWAFWRDQGPYAVKRHLLCARRMMKRLLHSKQRALMSREICSALSRVLTARKTQHGKEHRPHLRIYQGPALQVKCPSRRHNRKCRCLILRETLQSHLLLNYPTSRREECP